MEEDWMFPLGKRADLHPLTDQLMKNSVIDEGIAQSRFGVGSKVGNPEGWQLPTRREEKNQSVLDKLALKTQRREATKGANMALGIGEFIKSNDFKDYVRKLMEE